MRKKVITYDPTHYKRTPSVVAVYGKNDQKIRKTKTVTTPHKTKVVEYGPAAYTGKQTKTKTKKKY